MDDFSFQLANILDPSSFSINPADLLAASATPFTSLPHLPIAVAQPTNITQAKKIFKLCSEKKVPLHIQGNSTAILSPPAPPGKSWLLLKTTRLRKILSFAPEDHIISLQGGITVAELEKVLSPYNFCLTETSQHPLATIGGLLAENLLPPGFPDDSGLAARLLNLSVLTGNSEIFTFNALSGAPGVLSPEPPIAYVFCGSAGQLGLILDATFALLPLPAAVSSQAIQGSLKALLHISQQIFHASLPVSPLLLDEAFANIVTGKRIPLLLLKIKGSNADIENCLQFFKSVFSHLPVMHTSQLNDLPLPHFLATALSFSPRARSISILNAPPARLVAMLEAVTEIATEHQLEMHFFGYPNLARIYFSFGYEKEEQWADAIKDLFALKLVLGNSQDIENMLGENEETWKNKTTIIGTSLRKIFDPAGIFF